MTIRRAVQAVLRLGPICVDEQVLWVDGVDQAGVGVPPRGSPATAEGYCIRGIGRFKMSRRTNRFATKKQRIYLDFSPKISP